MQISAGAFNKKIQVIRYEITKDSDGFEAKTEITVLNTWAQVTNISGTELLRSNSDFSEVKTRFLIRTPKAEITKDMMMVYDDQEKIRKRVNAAYEIAKGAGCRGMVAGQVSDIEAENAVASNEMLEYIHLNKTGALIRAAVKAGLYLGSPDDKMIDNIQKYAEYLGLAYQIADDILDVVGNPEEMGKSMGSDVKKNKNTYPSINGLDAAYRRLDEVTSKAVESIGEYYDNAEFFRDLVLRLAKRKK